MVHFDLAQALVTRPHLIYPPVNPRAAHISEFPSVDLVELDRRRFVTPDYGETVDTQFWKMAPCCIGCGTWTCTGCRSHRRSGAARKNPHLQVCNKCGKNEGFYVATRHERDHEALPVPPYIVTGILQRKAHRG